MSEYIFFQSLVGFGWPLRACLEAWFYIKTTTTTTTKPLSPKQVGVGECKLQAWKILHLELENAVWMPCEPTRFTPVLD